MILTKIKYCNCKFVIKMFYRLEGSCNLSSEEKEEVTRLAVMWDEKTMAAEEVGEVA